MASSVRRTIPRILIVGVVLFLLAQLVRPAKTNPPIDPNLALEHFVTVPPEVGAILDRSCADCHTHRTIWPWYTDVAPSAWLVIRDVNEGRRHLNLSEWGKLDRAKMGRRLKGMCREVTRGEMPMWQYTLIHTGAKLSPADEKAICDWSDQAVAQLGPAAQKQPAETRHGTETPATPAGRAGQAPDAGSSGSSSPNPSR